MKYKIRSDDYAGYEVLFWRWWFPFWINDGYNTFSSIEKARWYAQNRKSIERGTVK